MALWDPEAAGNAAKYLRLDDITLIDIRNAPFEGKTACWIPYAETGYTMGKRTGKEETDEKTKVKKIEVERLVDGKMKMIKEEDVEPQNPPKYELLEDMANMTYLSEASVVHNLKSRYELFLIYTVSIWCGISMGLEAVKSISHRIRNHKSFSILVSSVSPSIPTSGSQYTTTTLFSVTKISAKLKCLLTSTPYPIMHTLIC